MKTITNLALVLFSMSAAAQEDFSKLKWRNRILVFSTQNLKDETFVAQWENFKSSSKKIDDRNILLFALSKGRILDKDLKVIPSYHIAPLRKKYNIPQTYEGITLIGKDGGVKLQKPLHTEPRVFFEAIDQMPMRQQEMRQNIDD
ncbi:MAG: hypothetical protein COA80_13235 [Leeuwenhoekiella sp.]|uniref:DUF4174 domain-containing protein n=1 Tax=Leeuwenhoekiella nanhaiensis TaxID=1655491 RepID=A0A2G1VN26_9FLAO|nr:DUF4174 domain-containing protein [Leeuwenhoekiella nanhaiensis]PHQ28010.1 hypothetical protein CJ305_17030 [Leeuwenhoekiella nanhaiensis]PHR93857.1 MAG: hypothetical protein COA80_13235 [Leeuwenhoekiella sp.]